MSNIKKVVVLGAGASRGASFVDSAARSAGHVYPPLNCDFFTQLQRMGSANPQKFFLKERASRKELVPLVMQDVVQEFGTNFALTMEEYFTHLEFATKVVNLSSRKKESEDPTSARYTVKRGHLLAAVAALLQVSLHETLSTGSECSHHKKLVESLSSDDTIISFNYDVLIDTALRKNGAGKWSAKYGYHLPRRSRELRQVTTKGNWDYWSPDAPASRKDCLALLKLHGSIHWQISEQRKSIGGRDSLLVSVKLKERLHYQNGVPDFTIIPPEWNKDFAESYVFGQLWTEAYSRLRGAKSLVVIGFSFALTDMYATSLFKLGLNKLDELVIVNPDHDARKRTRDVLKNAIAETTRVLQYSEFGEYADTLP